MLGMIVLLCCKAVARWRLHKKCRCAGLIICYQKCVANSLYKAQELQLVGDIGVGTILLIAYAQNLQVQITLC